jgi:hypothetical protein
VIKLYRTLDDFRFRRSTVPPRRCGTGRCGRGPASSRGNTVHARRNFHGKLGSDLSSTFWPHHTHARDAPRDQAHARARAPRRRSTHGRGPRTLPRPTVRACTRPPGRDLQLDITQRVQSRFRLGTLRLERKREAHSFSLMNGDPTLSGKREGTLGRFARHGR